MTTTTTTHKARRHRRTCPEPGCEGSGYVDYSDTPCPRPDCPRTDVPAAEAPDYVSTVWVVTWNPEGGIGGFEWRVDRAAAARFMRELQDPTARLRAVAVPDRLATADAWVITDWLDDEGYSDGVIRP